MLLQACKYLNYINKLSWNEFLRAILSEKQQITKPRRTIYTNNTTEVCVLILNILPTV